MTTRHLVSIADLDASEIVAILDHGDRYWSLADEPIKKLTSLRGRTVINLFYESSTRTRTSFELAAKRLSAEAINIAASSSSTTKGETLLDTGRNLMAMHPDAIVVRHSFGGAAALLARTAKCAVVNAGDGQHEHPTQALLDAATIRRHRGRVENLEVAIVGDIQHSRVARSNVLCLAKLGARVRLVAPYTLMPRGIELIGGELTRERVRVCTRLEDGLDGADVVMMLRVQHERFDGEAPRFPNTRELSRTFGLSERTLAYAKPDAIVMHPGPINRGVEVSPQVADGPRAAILQQVSWGVAIRMAVLERAVLGGRGVTDAALRVDGIVKRFGNHVAVDGISFEVPRGVVYGILGPNGAGKSTTLRMINDIIAPDAGTIAILGGLAPGQAARRIGYLPEERGLYPKMRVIEMIAFMGELRGLAAREAKRRAGEWLDKLGLADWATNKVQDLSKGMQQKVQFATALIHEPELVILDEPWSGLDPINADVLASTVESIRAAGRTVLFSTHQMEQAEKVCDAVCIIARGKKVLDGALRDIKRASTADGLVALAFADDASKQRAQAPLADRALVAEQRAPHHGDQADCEVALAAGVAPQQLLAALVGADVGLRRFEVVVPTLHQIFVARVGDAAATAQRSEPRDA